VLIIQRITAGQQKELEKGGCYWSTLRRSEGVAFLSPFNKEPSWAFGYHQKELAILTGVTVGQSIYGEWAVKPSMKKKQ